MTLTYVYPTPLPSTKGWGPGYPNCQTDKMVQHPIFQGGVHKRILELTNRLVKELEQRGYEFHDGWSWGFACRATKKSSGSQTSTPTFHSWGLALDFNAPLNVFGAARENTQLGKPAYHYVITLMHAYGFYWLGPEIGDWMHFSFVGSPADADKMRRKARRNGIGDKPVTRFKVGVKTFRLMRNAMDYLRDKLRHAKDGVALRIRKVTR